MYNGIINVNSLDANEILELLEACDELCFNELIDDLQRVLIKEDDEWIQQNLIEIYKISLHQRSFNLLKDYCNELIRENPDPILKSDDFTMIEEPIFISILKKDNIGLKEI